MEDPYEQCPYDRAHRVPRSRLRQHLVRCEERYPPLSVCPFNATHRLPSELMKRHVREQCVSREVVLPEERAGRPLRATVPHSQGLVADPAQEMWD